MDIIKAIDDYLLEQKKKDYTITNHWPSNASCIIDGKVVGKCLRAQWYGWRGIQPSNPFDLNALWMFFMGECIHLGIQRIFEKLKVKAEIEKPVDYTAPDIYPKHIRGRIDILFQEDKGHSDIWYGIEIKTTYGRAIIDPITGVKYCGPMGHHLVQILPYMRDNMQPEPYPYYIIYLARDTGWREHFGLLYNPYKDILYCESKATGVSWRSIIDRWCLLDDYLNRGVEPPRDFQLLYPDDVVKPMWEEYKEHSKAKKPMTFKAYKKDRGDWACKRCLYKDICHDLLVSDEVEEEALTAGHLY